MSYAGDGVSCPAGETCLLSGVAQVRDVLPSRKSHRVCEDVTQKLDYGFWNNEQGLRCQMRATTPRLI